MRDGVLAQRLALRVHPQHQRPPAAGARQPGQNADERGFARAAWAYDTDNFAFLDVEVDALEHLEWAEGFPDSVEFYHNGVKVNGKRRKKQEEKPLQLSREDLGVLGPV